MGLRDSRRPATPQALGIAPVPPNPVPWIVACVAVAALIAVLVIRPGSAATPEGPSAKPVDPKSGGSANRPTDVAGLQAEVARLESLLRQWEKAVADRDANLAKWKASLEERDETIRRLREGSGASGPPRGISPPKGGSLCPLCKGVGKADVATLADYRAKEYSLAKIAEIEEAGRTLGVQVMTEEERKERIRTLYEATYVSELTKLRAKAGGDTLVCDGCKGTGKVDDELFGK